MIRYEILMLAVPQITEDEGKRINAELETFIKVDGGSVISFERWGKYRLAYPIAKNDYGVYFLIRFELPELSKAIDEIKRAFKVRLNELVMRDMIVVLEADQSLEYQRPLSLEETPEREVGAFMKEKGAGFSRGDRGDRPDRGDRGDRGDRPDRGDRGDRGAAGAGDRGGFRPRGPRPAGDRPSYDRGPRSYSSSHATASVDTDKDTTGEA
jgi:small subunit ribosomal protein S6